MSFDNFLNDINLLYKKTKIEKLKSIYILASFNYGSDLYKFLVSNPNVKGELSNPIVYDALMSLLNIRKRYQYGVTKQDIVSYMVNYPTPSLPTIVAFNDLIDMPILKPFDDIIKATSNFQTTGKGGSVELRNDLNIISTIAEDLKSKKKDRYEVQEQSLSKKEIKKQQTAKMFSTLLKKVSDEIATAADKYNYTNFARDIRNGLLLKPFEMIKYDKNIKTSVYGVQEARDIVKFLMAHVELNDVTLNYNYLRERALVFAGQLSREDLIKFQEQRRHKIDVAKFMKPDSITSEDFKQGMSIGISDDKLLDSSSLGMFMLIFTEFYRQLEY